MTLSLWENFLNDCWCIRNNRYKLNIIQLYGLQDTKQQKKKETKQTKHKTKNNFIKKHLYKKYPSTLNK